MLTLLVIGSSVFCVFATGLGTLWYYKREAVARDFYEESIATGTNRPASLHPVIDTSTCIGSGACVDACPEKVLGVINGDAHLIQAASCVGHGTCREACPIDAISLVFGTAERGVDIPILRAGYETNVPGIHIAGELGGMGLIRNAMRQGMASVERVAEALEEEGPSPDKKAVDVLIVGAGPAGLAAALKATEQGLSFQLLDQYRLGGSVAHYPRKKIVMSERLVLPIVGKFGKAQMIKEELVAEFERMAGVAGIDVLEERRVVAVTKKRGVFRVTAETPEGQEKHRARRIVLAIGRRGTPRKLGVTGEDLSHVTYRLLEPEQHRHRAVLVVGGGDSAVEAALAVADAAGSRVALSYRGKGFFRVRRKNRKRLEAAEAAGKLEVHLETTVKEIRKGEVTLTDRDGQTYSLPAEDVIVNAGGVLPTPFLKSMGIQVEAKHGEPIEGGASSRRLRLAESSKRAARVYERHSKRLPIQNKASECAGARESRRLVGNREGSKRVTKRAGRVKRSLTTAAVLMLAAMTTMGCSQGSDSAGPSSTAAGVSSATSATSGRDPMGYAWDMPTDTNQIPGGYVSALSASPSTTEVLAADYPNRQVLGVSGQTVSPAGSFPFEVTGFVAGGALMATTGEPSSPGAGDLYERSGTGWQPILDTADNQLVAGVVNGDLYAVSGQEGDQAQLHTRLAGSTQWEARLGAFAHPGAPTAAVAWLGELWVGVGSHLYHGNQAGFVDSLAPIGPGQHVSALLARRDSVVVATAAFDEATGQPIGGMVIAYERRVFRVLASFNQDAPTALAELDGTIYVGTAAGKLRYLDDQGLWRDEPNVPANFGIHALAVRDASTLFVGADGPNGGQLFVRHAVSASAPAPAAPAPAGVLDYLTGIKPLLSASCVACHSTMPTGYVLSAGLADDTADYDATVAQLDLAAPESSPFLTEASNTTPHAGGALWASGSAEYQTVVQWIAAGAVFDGGNAAPAPAAPVANPTYLADAKPVLAQLCEACHNSMSGYRVSPGMADDMGDYQATLLYLDMATPANSELLTRATQVRGHPVKSFDVGSAPYDTLLRWIEGGAPFN